MTAKKTPKPHANSKAAQIRALSKDGKLTPKQIARMVGAPPAYVYVLRSRMKAKGGIPRAVPPTSPMPVLGGIQEVATKHEAVSSVPVVIQRPPLWDRVKERIRAWFA